MSTLRFPYYLTTTQGFASRISTINSNSMKYQARFHTEFLYSKTGEWIPQFMYAERHQYQQRDFCFIQLHSKKVKCEDKIRSTKQGRSRERTGPQLTNVRCRTSKTASLHPQSQPHFRGFTNCPGFSRRQKFHSCLLTFFMAMFIMDTHQCHSYEAWNVKRYIGVNQGYNFICFSKILFLKVYQYILLWTSHKEILNSSLVN